MEELLFEGVGHALVQRNVCPLTHFAVDNVMVAYCLHAPLRPDHLVWLITDSAKGFRETNTDESLQNEVHFVNLLKLLVYYFINRFGHKPSGQEALREEVEQLLVRRLAAWEVSRLEKAREFSDYVREEVVNSDCFFYIIGDVDYLRVSWVVEIFVAVV